MIRGRTTRYGPDSGSLLDVGNTLVDVVEPQGAAGPHHTLTAVSYTIRGAAHDACERGVFSQYSDTHAA